MSKSDSTKVSPVYLKIIEDGGSFALSFEDNILCTADGNSELRHGARQLLEHIVNEFDGYGTIEICDQTITEPNFLVLMHCSVSRKNGLSLIRMS